MRSGRSAKTPAKTATTTLQMMNVCHETLKNPKKAGWPKVETPAPKDLLTELPAELLLVIFFTLSFKDMSAVSGASPRAKAIFNSYDFIRNREL